MNLKDRIIAAKRESSPLFRERYAASKVKPLGEVNDLMRRGLEDPAARKEAREAIIAAVDLLMEHPESAHLLLAVAYEAFKLSQPRPPERPIPSSIAELSEQIEDEF
ncbi:TPA: hypothetical protein RHY41_004392 [Escherichia coli]|nr:hypothetical protein [Escherichia coli]EJD4214359.1 hypothetical protein [Escherichia coli]EKV5484744.1 hypothetical protein [Escherichia coli]HBB7044603.1 hypothetical protein [Escherichia coli]HDV2374291.1 hypothetical protein [Escherichia coli]